MKKFSKVLLLSAVSLSVSSSNITYASFEDVSSHLKSGIPTLHTHHTYIRHTLQRLDLSSPLFKPLADKGNQSYQTANVCFITDTGACSNNEFGNLETPEGGNNGGNPDDHGTPEELCEDAGYTNTPCPEGSIPGDFCPYDSSYHGECKCPEDYVTCSLPQVGIGPSCDGKYQECCTPLTDETDCPYGITTGDDGCGGTRTICKDCTPLADETDCKYGTTTTDDGCGGTRTACKDCTPLEDQTNCPYGTVSGDDGCGGLRAVCKDCTPLPNETDCPYGVGVTVADDGCGGTRIVCKECPNECTLTSCPSPFTCRYEACSKRYCKEGCKSGYEWNAQTQSCDTPCSSSYQYDENNCPSNQNYHCSSSCGNKYEDCISAPSSLQNWPNSFTLGNFTFAQNESDCSSGEFSAGGANFGNIQYGQCLFNNIDTECQNLYQAIYRGESYSLPYSINCGNMDFRIFDVSDQAYVDGNGNTLNLSTLSHIPFPEQVHLNNITVIQESSSSEYKYQNMNGCSIWDDELHAGPSVYPEENDFRLGSNVYIKSPSVKVAVVENNATLITNWVNALVNANSEVNISPFYEYNRDVYRTHVIAKENAVANIKNTEANDYSIYITARGENATINLCNTGSNPEITLDWYDSDDYFPGQSRPFSCKNITINMNQDIKISTETISTNHRACMDYVTKNINSGLCSQMSF